MADGCAEEALNSLLQGQVKTADSCGGHSMLVGSSSTLHTKLSLHLLCCCVFLTSLLPQPSHYPRAQLPTTFKGIWINTLRSGSSVEFSPRWPAEPGAAQKTSCLRTDTAPTVHLGVASSSYWCPSSPQTNGGQTCKHSKDYSGANSQHTTEREAVSYLQLKLEVVWGVSVG